MIYIEALLQPPSKVLGGNVLGIAFSEDAERRIILLEVSPVAPDVDLGNNVILIDVNSDIGFIQSGVASKRPLLISGL